MTSLLRPISLLEQVLSLRATAPSTSWLQSWQARAASRRGEDRLRRLSPHTLRDIGL
jgi:uncharacterized protein YjiS (DUF1127 family)